MTRHKTMDPCLKHAGMTALKAHGFPPGHCGNDKAKLLDRSRISKRFSAYWGPQARDRYEVFFIEVERYFTVNRVR
jgi:hypothetical protein